MVSLAGTGDKLAKDHTAAEKAKRDEQSDEQTNETAPPSSPPESRSDSPPPYTPRKGPSGPRCTCPRHSDGDQAQTATTPPREEDKGTDWLKVAAGTAAVAVAVPTLAVAGAAVALPLIGFSSAGVVGGSIAAGIQSAVYGGATCGLFSVFQSIGATIVAPAALEVAAMAGTAAVGGMAISEGVKAGARDQADANNGGGNGGAGNDTTRVECECAACECDESCECACRMRRRRLRQCASR